MDVVQVGIELVKLVVEQILVVCDVKVRLRSCIDEAVLLTDCEDIFFEAESLKVVDCDCSDLQAFRAFDILLYSGILVEQVPDLLHLYIDIATVLIAKKFVQNLKLTELEHTIVLQISSHKDIVDVLQLFSLQLIGRVNDKLSKIV